MNAFTRRLQPGGAGRPKDFASAAAHVFLKECSLQLAASTGGMCPDPFARARDDIRSLTRAAPNPRRAGRARGATFGYNEFCKAEHSRLKAETNARSPHAERLFSHSGPHQPVMASTVGNNKSLLDQPGHCQKPSRPLGRARSFGSPGIPGNGAVRSQSHGSCRKRSPATHEAF